jgi:hypothetical protein
VVRIGRQGDAVTLGGVYRRFRSRGVDDAPPVVALALTDWARLRDALIAASFWALDPPTGWSGRSSLIPSERPQPILAARGLDGGARAGTLHDLGKLFFDLAGPPLGGG